MASSNLISGRLAFHQIDPEMCALLKEAKPMIMEELGPVMDGFYRHISSFDETNGMFRDPAHKEHAKQTHMRHWSLITDGQFDENYAASVTRIGETHYRLGLEPRLYIAGYSVVISTLAQRATERMLGKGSRRNASEKLGKLQAAIIKAGMLDIDLAISVYVDVERRAREKTSESAAKFEVALNSAIQTVLGSATDIDNAANEMSSSADQTQEQATSAAAAAEKASTNVRTVAATAEELSASVRDIGQQTSVSGEISVQAVETAQEAMSKVQLLEEAAKKIGAILDLINGIASQTNLLALNATIEAARAGEAGRGFAVVAQEVKALAEQTAKATAEISQQIGGIQGTTAGTVTAIDKISEIIRTMNDMTTAIASAIVEQGAATDEIAQNVNEAAQGTSSVSASIVSASEAAESTKSEADKVLSFAKGLSEQAGNLRESASEFMTAIRAA